MTKHEMIPSAQRHEVRWLQLKFWLRVEGFNMVNLDVHSCSADDASRLDPQVLYPHSAPLAGPLCKRPGTADEGQPAGNPKEHPEPRPTSHSGSSSQLNQPSEQATATVEQNVNDGHG